MYTYFSNDIDVIYGRTGATLMMIFFLKGGKKGGGAKLSHSCGHPIAGEVGCKKNSKTEYIYYLHLLLKLVRINIEMQND